MLSDTPTERDIEWTEAGVEGSWRFTQRQSRQVADANLVIRVFRALPGDIDQDTFSHQPVQGNGINRFALG